MARMIATASLAVLLFSLLAVANCRVLEAETDTDGDGASFVVAVPEEQGISKPAVSQEAGATEVVLPTDSTSFVAGEGFLRLPFHRHHRHPCRHGQGLFHRHLWWARHHDLSHRHGEARAAHLAVVPTELAHEEEPRELEQEEVKAVAEPDPDSQPDTDGENVEEETKPYHGEEEENEMLKAWKGEMLRRFRHGLGFHHRHHLRHHHEEEEEENDHDHEEDKQQQGARATKHFQFQHHDEEQMMTRKRFHHDSDNEVDEVEELARRLSKAIMRRRFGHGRRRRHHHHAEEADTEEGGVKKWFKGLMNRF